MPSASQKPSLKLAPFPDLSPGNSPVTQSKRRLEDDDEIPSSLRPTKILKTYAPYEKHGTHWYLDGNLFLQVGNTRFRVHCSRLASESEWFQALIDYWNGMIPDGREVPEDVGPIADASDTIGDDPLFFLDAEEGQEVPGADELAALLTAMYRGIDYVFDLPTVDEIRLLYGAAFHYDVTRYETFAMKYMERLFPEFSKITREPSLQNAIHGIHIGQMFNAPKIYSRALLDLARTSTQSFKECLPPKAVEPPQTATIAAEPVAAPSIDVAAQVSLAGTNGANASTRDENSEPDKNKNVLEALSAVDFTRVIILQRDLAGIWDNITSDTMSASCNISTCRNAYKTNFTFEIITPVKAQFLCDPLLGIDKLCGNIPHVSYSCSHARSTLISRLGERKAEICKYLEERQST